MEQALPRDGWRLKFSYLALGIAVFAVIWFMAAALGTRFGLWDFRFSFGTLLRGLGPYVAGAAVISSVVALILSLVASPRKKPFIIGLLATLVSAMLSFRLYALLLSVGLIGDGPPIPPIHNIQTDWSNEVYFSEELLEVRGPDSNPVVSGEEAVFFNPDSEAWGGKTLAKIQEDAEFNPAVDDDPDDKPYGTLEPLILDAAPEMVFAAAERLVKRRGWTVVTSDADAGTLEATHTSTWFGFKDDVAIRFLAEGEGTRVDMRSVSRVGVSDLGANAKRISLFLNDLGGQRYD